MMNQEYGGLKRFKNSPFQAKSVVQHHVGNILKTTEDSLTIECCQLLQKFIYIDDVLLGLKDEDRAIKIVNEIRSIFKTMNMDLSKLVSNSLEVLKKTKQEVSNEDGNNQEEEVEISKPTKILGTMWDPNDNTLSFPYIRLLKSEIEHTK